MSDFGALLIHFIATVLKMLRPGGARSVVAESTLLKHQLLILNRSRERAPNLRPMDRIIAGFVPASSARIALYAQPFRSHWVMVVMDQFTRRIVDFAVHPHAPDGPAICRMFNEAAAGMRHLPCHLSSDNDPLFRYHRWKANLKILEVSEVKTVPYVPLSHPFAERLIGTIRREYLDHVPFWNSVDLQRKLDDFKTYYNAYRVHHSLDGATPNSVTASRPKRNTARGEISWKSHCGGLFQLPATA